MSFAAGCFYCGKVGAWFACDCVWVREIREGRRAQPRVRIVDGRTIIVVDAETAERNVLGYPRYGGKSRPAAIVGDGFTVVEVAGEGEELPKPTRAAYLREWRAKRKGGGL